MGYHYTMPPGGWTCWFCGETFTTPGAARDHFGTEPIDQAACQIKAGEEGGLVMALRKAEHELRRYRAEDSDVDRWFHLMRFDHAQAMIQVEQEAYDRGLAEGWEIEPTKREEEEGMGEPIQGMPVMRVEGMKPIPWDVIEPHEWQAQANHRQSLKRLAERGGLDPAEAVAILEDRPWHRMDLKAAIERLKELIALTPATLA